VTPAATPAAMPADGPAAGAADLLAAPARTPDEWVSRTRAAFREAHGRDAELVWFGPGRVNLIGEHTDYSGGFVLPLALTYGTAVAAARATGPTSSVTSTSQDDVVRFDAATVAPGDVADWAAYVAGTAWALRTGETAVDVPALDIAVDSDLPTGAGLSSSAALECAVGGALAALAGREDVLADPMRIALAAKRAENDFLDAPTGYMDQMASMLGRDGAALFIDTRSLAAEPVPFDLPAAGLALLVVDSHAPHRHADGEYAARRRSCEQATAELGVEALRDLSVDDLDDRLSELSTDELRRRVRHVVTENARVLATVRLLRDAAAGSSDIRSIGQLLTASHASMRDDFQITVAEVDVLVQAAVDAGAHGARMTGGGFGGSVIALVEQGSADRVAAAMAAAAVGAGHAMPVAYRAVPAAGARRIG
jgi:galactokinase